jgi:SAV_6107-like HEPN
MPHAPIPQASFDLLHLAARGLAAAALHVGPEPATVGERYAEAHLAALRAASAVLAARARPARVRRGPSSVWTLLPEVAPELVEWSAFFAAGAGKRAAAEAGLPVVSAREADDLVRDATHFLALVETTLGLDHQVTLPLTG